MELDDETHWTKGNTTTDSLFGEDSVGTSEARLSDIAATLSPSTAGTTGAMFLPVPIAT